MLNESLQKIKTNSPGLFRFLNTAYGKFSDITKYLYRMLDILLSPLTIIGALILGFIRKSGVQNMPVSRKIFNAVGVFPIIDHYYEPLFNSSKLRKSLREDRVLPGIDLNVAEQLEILNRFHFNEELGKLPPFKAPFLSGDAEYLYNMIRLFKPSKMVEIGSGQSTRIASLAIRQNCREDKSYRCDHTCIEPFEAKWLESMGVTVIRECVENVDRDLFTALKANDILFIDSSHMIRPQGDVVTEYIEILPLLQRGVLVHIHDIFTPKDYLDEWITLNVFFWNEQYLLEAFLTMNNQFRIIGALNYLKHHYADELCRKSPLLARELKNREPGSFWLMRN